MFKDDTPVIAGTGTSGAYDGLCQCPQQPKGPSQWCKVESFPSNEELTLDNGNKLHEMIEMCLLLLLPVYQPEGASQDMRQCQRLLPDMSLLFNLVNPLNLLQKFQKASIFYHGNFWSQYSIQQMHEREVDIVDADCVCSAVACLCSDTSSQQRNNTVTTTKNKREKHN